MPFVVYESINFKNLSKADKKYTNNTTVDITKIIENIYSIHEQFILNFEEAHNYINNNYNNKECNIILDLVGDHYDKFYLHNLPEKEIKRLSKKFNRISLKNNLTYDTQYKK